MRTTFKKHRTRRYIAAMTAICLTVCLIQPSYSAVKSGASGTASNSLLGAGYNGAKYKSSHYASNSAVKFGIKSGSKTYTGYCLNANLKNRTGTAYAAKTASGSSMYKKLNSASRTWLPILMVYGYHPGKGSPVTKANANDYYMATQVIAWEFTSGYRSSPTKRSSTKEFKILDGKPAERCYNWILKEMANHAKGASFTKTTKGSANTYTMKYSYSTKKWSVTVTDTTAVNYLKKLSSSTAGLSMSRSGYKYTFSATKAGTYTAALANSGLGNYDGSANQPLLIWQAKSGTALNQSVSVGAIDETEFFVKLKTEATGTAKIVKTSGSGKKDGFRFNITCSSNGYSGSFTTNSSGLITANLYPGSYVVAEKLTTAQLAAGYEQAAPKTVTVKEGVTATVNIYNAYTEWKPGLKILKETTDGGSVEGFTFKTEGVRFNSKTLAAADVLSTADPQVTGLDDYDIGTWKVDEDDLKKVNQAAKEGKTGNYPVKLTNQAKLKPVEPTDPTNPTDSTDATDPSDLTEPTEPKPETVNLEVAVKITLSHVEYPAAGKTEKTSEHITYNDFEWSGSATVVSMLDKTDRIGRIIYDNLEFGTYTITEIMNDKQADRYHEPQVQRVTLTEDNPSASVSVTYKNIARKGDIKIKKTSVDGKIADVEFTITGTTAWGQEIEPIVRMTDDDGYIDIKNLAAGTYTIKESSLDPEIYVPQEPQTITITGDETEPIEVFFENIPYTDVEISKQSETTGEELPGVALQILDKATGEVIEEWTSTEEPHIVKGLEYGKEYILHEDLAPLGYAFAQDIVFIAGNEQKITMVDEVSKLLITKIDMETGIYLAGATYELQNPETKEVMATFTTPETKDGSLMYVEIEGLIEGNRYIVHETQAPNGYSLGEDQEVIFENGMVVAMGNLENGTVVITSEDEVNRLQNKNDGEPYERGNGSPTQTGDDFLILPYVLLSFAGAITAGIVWLRRKDKEEIFK